MSIENRLLKQLTRMIRVGRVPVLMLPLLASTGSRPPDPFGKGAGWEFLQENRGLLPSFGFSGKSAERQYLSCEPLLAQSALRESVLVGIQNI